MVFHIEKCIKVKVESSIVLKHFEQYIPCGFKNGSLVKNLLCFKFSVFYAISVNTLKICNKLSCFIYTVRNFAHNIR